MPQQTQYTDDEVEGHLRRYLATREWKSTAIGYAIDNDINYRTLKGWLSGKTHPEVYKKFSPEERENFSVRGICTDQEGATLLKQFADGDHRTVGEFTEKWDIQATTFQSWVSGRVRPQLRALLPAEYVEKLDRLRSLPATPQSVRSSLDRALNPRGNKYAWLKAGSADVGSSTASTSGGPSAGTPREQAAASHSKQPPTPGEPEEQVATGRRGPTPSDAPRQPEPRPQGQLAQGAQGVALAARTKLPAGRTSGAGTSASASNAPSSSTTSYQGRKRAASPSGNGERKGFKPKAS